MPCLKTFLFNKHLNSFSCFQFLSVHLFFLFFFFWFLTGSLLSISWVNYWSNVCVRPGCSPVCVCVPWCTCLCALVQVRVSVHSYMCIMCKCMCVCVYVMVCTWCALTKAIWITCYWSWCVCVFVKGPPKGGWGFLMSLPSGISGLSVWSYFSISISSVVQFCHSYHSFLALPFLLLAHSPDFFPP